MQSTNKRIIYIIMFVTLLLITTGCGEPEPETLRLATTTSTYDSGLLDAILADFESANNAEVSVVAVGTGQALALGESGDVDVILVHAPSRETEFVSAGHGTGRFDVMYNDFIVVGPVSDPAGIAGMPSVNEALQAIAATGSTFASRGDDSGTHTKEVSLWTSAEISDYANAEWYKSLGQGMGETLNFANESDAYTITDRGTFLALQDNLPNMLIMVGGLDISENADSSLYNPYGVIPINPNKGNINEALAMAFVEWLTAVDTQTVISEFGLETYDQPLFYPNSEQWHNQ